MNNDFMQQNTPGSDTSGTKRCPRCGAELPADSVFCGECGANLRTSETFAAPPRHVPSADTAPLQTSDYLILHLLNMIPLVGRILMLVWAFSENVNLNRRNFCRAYLIMYAISIALSVVFIILYAVILGVMFSSTNVFSDSVLEPFGMIFH